MRRFKISILVVFSIVVWLGAGANESQAESIVFLSEGIGNDAHSDRSLDDFLSPFRVGVEKCSSEVIGQAAEPLKVRTKPENGVANFAADSLRIIGSEVFETEIDAAFTNYGGLRIDLEKGPITVGSMAELSPFENFLVLLEMKGDQLRKIAGALARSGGWPQSGLEIEFDDEGKVLSLKANSQAVRDDQKYKIVTIDYLFLSDTRSYPKEEMIAVIQSSVRQRDAMIEYMKRLHKNGIALKNEGDGRTRITR